MNRESSSNELPIVCDLNAIPEASRKEHCASAPQLFEMAQQVRELEGGYAFGFPDQPGMLMRLAHFVENERLCCAWASFALEVNSGGGPIWLRFTGTAEAGAFLKTAFADPLRAAQIGLIEAESTEHVDQVMTKAAPVFAEVLEKIEP